MLPVVVMFAASVGTAFAQSAPATAGLSRAAGTPVTIDAASGSRLPLPRREDMADEASARIYAALAGPSGEPPRGAIAIALYSPAVAAALGRIDDYLRGGSTLTPRIFELLALVAAREMSLAYEWSVHEPAALRAGLPPAVVEVVRRNEPVTGLSELDALLIDFGRQLFRSRHVESATFAALAEWGRRLWPEHAAAGKLPA